MKRFSEKKAAVVTEEERLKVMNSLPGGYRAGYFATVIIITSAFTGIYAYRAGR